MRRHLPIALIAALIPTAALVALLASPAHADVPGPPVIRCRASGSNLVEIITPQGWAFASWTVAGQYDTAEVGVQREGQGFREPHTLPLGIPKPGWNFLAILTGALISGLIGGGVALYSLNKQRRYDVLATATALQAGVSRVEGILHQYIDEVMQHGDIRTPSSHLQRLTSQMQVYTALLPKFGALGPIVARETVTFYTGIDELASDMERSGPRAPPQTHKGLAVRANALKRQAEDLDRLLKRQFPELRPRFRRKPRLPFRRK